MGNAVPARENGTVDMGERLRRVVVPMRSTMDRPVIPALTGLRFLAALMVLIGHAGGILPIQDPNYGVAFWIQQVTTTGMSLFFVLSGFVIWINYAAAFRERPFHEACRDFMTARVARLFPMYCATIILALAMGALMPALDRMPWPLLTLVMLQAWVPGGGGELAIFGIDMVGHLWSVSVEMFFYLFFPVFAVLFWRLRSVRQAVAVSVLNTVLLAAAFYLAFRFGVRLMAPIEPQIAGQGMAWLTYYSPYAHISEFIAGCLGGLIFMTMRSKVAIDRPKTDTVIAALLTVGFIGLFLPKAAVRYFPADTIPLVVGAQLAAVVLIPVILVHVSLNRTFLSRMMSCPVMLLGGECSYSTYLLHPFLLRFFLFYWGGPYAPSLPEYLFRLVVLACAITILAYGSYTLIERPGRTYLRRVFGGARMSKGT
jgi:peptidoglycan/LPS O-acetylase OafA/YrhL